MLESGHAIAAYRVVKPLAENQVYQTYLVDHPEHGECRLLLLDSDQLAGIKERHDFLEQAKLLREKSLPGICTLLDAQSSDDFSYCVFPSPVGVPLTELLEDGFPPQEALALVKQIATGLSLMHSSGLWHGHLSADTIYLDQGRVALADFALASLVRIDFNSAVDPRYASPELVCGEVLGPPADLYSLGILLYRILTGEVPFDAEESFATAMLHMRGEVAPLSGELCQFQSLIDGLLQSLPDERFTARELIVEIERLLATTGLTPADEKPDGLRDVINSSTSLSPPLDENEQSQEQTTLDTDSTPAPKAEKRSAFERLAAGTDMQARAEQRLQERAAALQASETMTSDATRASSQRMAAISRQIHEIRQPMNRQNNPQTTSNFGRFTILAVLGVVVGGILYFAIFDRPPQAQPQAEVGIPNDLKSALQSGSIQLQTGQFEAAEQLFLGLLKDYSLYPQPYNNLASVYAAQGDLEQARNYLEKALATDESYATIYRNLGTVYSEMARDSYGRALQLEKGEQAVRLQLFPGNAEVVVASSGQQQPSEGEPAETPVATSEPAVMLAQVEPAAEAVVVQPPTKVAPPKKVGSNDLLEPAGREAEPSTPIAAKPTLPAQVQPEPAPEIPNQESTPEIPNQEPDMETGEVFLQRWATAWSKQAVDEYLAFYAADFTPSSGASRSTWEQQRRSRLVKPKKIEVGLSDFIKLEQSEDWVKLEVTQSYQSDRYADKTRKLFDLVKQGDGWQILRERSLGRVR